MTRIASIARQLRKSATRGLVTLCLLTWATGAWSLSTAVKLADLGFASWTAKDGVPAGNLSSLVQGAEGFLWMSSISDSEPYRFDGRHFERVSLPHTDRSNGASGQIYRLFAPKAGGLWVGYAFGGAAFFNGSQLKEYAERDGLPAGSVKTFAEDSEGTLWVATTHGLARLRMGRWEHVEGPDAASFNPYELLFDTEGALWVLTDGRVFRLPKGSHVWSQYPNASGLAESADGQMWFSDESGVHFLLDVKNPSHQLIAAVGTLLFDRDGALWGDSPSGLARITRLSELPAHKSILWSDLNWVDLFDNHTRAFREIASVLEDREGNIWVISKSGIAEFYDRNLRRPFEVPTSFVGVTAADDGGLWLTAARGFPSPIWKYDGHVLVARSEKLDNIGSQLRARDGSIWFGVRGELLHASREALQQPSGDLHWSDRLKLPDASSESEVQAIAEDGSGAVWASIVRRGLYKYAGGQWFENGGFKDLPGPYPATVSSDTKGRIWLGYPGNKIVRLDGDMPRLFAGTEGVTVGNVLAIYGRRSHIWAAGEAGLAVLDGDRFRQITARPPIRLEGITGIVETEEGDLWLNASTGIVHITAADLRPVLGRLTTSAQAEVFDAHDGFEGRGAPIRPHPTAIEGPDGKLWFATNAAVFSIDPKHLIRNAIPPPVVITSLSVGDRFYSATNGLRLAEDSTALRISYVGLSLTNPDKVRYRYKLDGVNQEWQDAEGRQEAYFINVRPGSYHFHVTAANNDGVWNEQGSTLDFTIPARFTQTPWFFALCALAAGGLVALAFRLRMHQVAARMRLRLNERHRERERIARELHDTLLQSTQGLMLRVQVARNHIRPGDPARDELDLALKRADEVIEEARDRVQDLRIPAEAQAGLAGSLESVGKELAIGRSVSFQVRTHGNERPLVPKVFEEVFSIAREALVNAFHHARATEISVSISYGPEELRVQVSDNGCGIEAQVLKEGSKAEHWGLRGMRERAREVGADYEITSNVGKGTVIALSVPKAFRTAGFFWLRRLWGDPESLQENGV